MSSDRLFSSNQETILEKSVHNAIVFHHVNVAISVKLDRCNFLIWRQYMLSLITTYGLEEYIELRKYLVFIYFGSVNLEYSMEIRI